MLLCQFLPCKFVLERTISRQTYIRQWPLCDVANVRRLESDGLLAKPHV